MYRRTAQRGIAALAFVLLLTLVGAQPAAAAADQGFLDRLAGFWGAVTGAPQAPSLWNMVAGWFGQEKTSTSDPSHPSDEGDKGWGIDPNGLRLLTTDPPVSGGGN